MSGFELRNLHSSESAMDFCTRLHDLAEQWRREATDRKAVVDAVILEQLLSSLPSEVVLSWSLRLDKKKKRTIREICGEKNAVPSSDIMLDDARSAQGKSRGLSRT